MTVSEDLDPVTQGDDEEYGLTFTKDDGSAYDITNWTVYVTVKRSHDDSDDDAVISKDITNHTLPTDGETDFTFTASETQNLQGPYVYDIQVKKGDGSITTVVEGTVKFVEGVTTRA